MLACIIVLAIVGRDLLENMLRAGKKHKDTC